MTTDCEHAWQPFDEAEMKTLRSASRAGRPPGAWVDAAERCSKCGRVEANVNWFGQLHRVLYGPKGSSSANVIHWPTRSQTPGMGMREA